MSQTTFTCCGCHWLVRRTLGRVETGEGAGVHIVARPAVPGAFVRVQLDTDVDDSRVALGECLGGVALLIRNTRTEVLYEDVGLLDQLVDVFAILRNARIEIGLSLAGLGGKEKVPELYPVRHVQVHALGPLAGQRSTHTGPRNRMHHRQYFQPGQRALTLRQGIGSLSRSSRCGSAGSRRGPGPAP